MTDPEGPQPETESPAADAAAADPPAAEAPAPPAGETLEEAVARLTRESQQARDDKEAADSRYADVDGRLAAVLNLQRDIEKAGQAYGAVYPQLLADEKAYAEFHDSETENLKRLLGPATLADLENQVATSAASLAQAQADVDAKSTALQAAVQDRDQADQVRKEKDAAAKELKNLGGTVAARHAKVKTFRDEITKARQAEFYALAYWLLEKRDYTVTLNGSPALVAPEALPDTLLQAVNGLADAERDFAQKAATAVKRQDDLAVAEKRLADEKSQGEARLRDDLKQLTPTET